MGDDDALGAVESRQMPAELLEPDLWARRVGVGQLGVGDLGTLLPQAVCQPVLPVLGRPTVLPPVEDQETASLLRAHVDPGFGTPAATAIEPHSCRASALCGSASARAAPRELTAPFGTRNATNLSSGL